uniref:DUF7722 domain-containing protein n=1 Tax=Manihot esculenta TaxID=3983 RepID=A0A2C9V2U7_MANES
MSMAATVESAEANKKPAVEVEHTNNNDKKKTMVIECNTFKMPLHYPSYSKEEYQDMAEWRLDLLLQQYGLPINGRSLAYKREMAICCFLWPEPRSKLITASPADGSLIRRQASSSMLFSGEEDRSNQGRGRSFPFGRAPLRTAAAQLRTAAAQLRTAAAQRRTFIPFIPFIPFKAFFGRWHDTGPFRTLTPPLEAIATVPKIQLN